MPIYKGTNNLSLAKGTIPISSVYKGTTLVYSSYTWEQWYQTFLYNALIPQTINSKNVLNQAKIVKVESNGVVENQLVQNGNFVDFSNWATSGGSTVYSVANNILTFKAVQRYGGVRQTLDIVAGHKYLFTWNIKMGTTPTSSGTTVVATLTNVSPQESRAELNTNWQKLSLLTTANSGQTQSILYIRDFAESSWADNQVRDVMIFDLTIMFGTGNEPTALTDTRIEALLNRGYISYNTGTYKGTDIGVISSEPYNLLSLDRTQGTLNGSSYTKGNKQNFKESEYYLGLAQNDYIHQSAISSVSISNNSITFTTAQPAYGLALPIRVLGGVSYSLDITIPTSGECSVSYYNENGEYISYTTNPQNSPFTIPTNAYWGVILLKASANGTYTFSNICFHITGTRTGYSPYQTLTPITFKYQGNGAISTHDTFEITSSSYVFTRNVATVNMETLSWYNGGSGNFSYNLASIGFANKGLNVAQILCSKYAVGSSNVDKTIRSNSGYVAIYDTSITQVSEITGTLVFELATPQVISIPKKHLGIVDLGSLNWTYYSGTGVFWAAVSDIKVQTPNLICSKYLTQGYVSSSANLQNGYIGTNMWTGNGNQIIVKDTLFTNATDFKNAMSGVYLFYETDTETTDIDTKIGIESGGTITSNWFSWKKHQLVVNGNFATQTTWSLYNLSGASWSASDNIATVVVNSMTTTYGQFYQNITIVNNHKYLLKVDVKTSANESIGWRLGQGSATTISATTSWQTFTQIATRTDSGRDFGLYLKNTITTPLTVYLKNVMYFDLTLAFGSGNEPTSTSDPRIQYIINNGYIPTDTTGTETLVDSQVLPNIDLRLKSK